MGSGNGKAFSIDDLSDLIREIEQMLGADQTVIVHPSADTAAIADRFPSLTIIVSPYVLENEAILINDRRLEEALYPHHWIVGLDPATPDQQPQVLHVGYRVCGCGRNADIPHNCVTIDDVTWSSTDTTI